MKKIILLAIVVSMGYYGYLWYKQNGLPFARNSSSIYETKVLEKCITNDGRVIYGDVPPGTVCVRKEPVKGSVTVLPKESFGRHEK